MLTPFTAHQNSVQIGYVPLLDCAPLIVAQEAGLFAAEGLHVTLQRESNWASIRDKLSLGILDAAHILAPMVLASQLAPANTDRAKSFKTALAMGYNGNAITLSSQIYQQLVVTEHSFLAIAAALKTHLGLGTQTLTVGTVHPHSMHTYLLHLFLNRAGIDMARVAIKVIPPVNMVEAMQQGEVDLYCVGEPWNTAAQIAQAGHIICYGSELWAHAPEKVLGVNQGFAQTRAEVHEKMLSAIVRACQWLESADHIAQSALWLAKPAYLNCSSDLLIQAMLGQWHTQRRGSHQHKVFFSEQANAPWPAHAQWILQAMQAYNQIDTTKLSVSLDALYDWDTYQRVMTRLDLPVIERASFPGLLPAIHSPEFLSS
jgi:ABC-type nitrate/sulfonate/bicarbonate transport system substrate-binding protein